MTIEPTAQTLDDVYIDLKRACAKKFDIELSNPVPLSLGLLNLKWKVETDQGTPLVLKQFSRTRYEAFGLSQVAQEQELALQEQLRQHEAGTPCPRILTNMGQVIQQSDTGERFVVMEYMSGENLPPGTVNTLQMYDLGRWTAHLHNVANDGTRVAAGESKFIPPSRNNRLAHWQTLRANVPGDERLIALIDQQISATRRFDVSLLRTCVPGWAHRDLWVDNILFTDNAVAAILDFDRFAFDYPELDIARAVMSGSLQGTDFNPDNARAFIRGYNTLRPVHPGMLMRALQLLWYMESVWWVVPNLNLARYQEVQFQNEMNWLAEHLLELSSILADT